MGWWFGRKDAPADVRPFVPAWLSTVDAEAGFARSVEGMTVSIRDSGLSATYRGGSWDVGVVSATGLWVGGKQVVGPQAAAITGPVGGSSIDAQCREAVERILAALRQHGLVET